jgi:hypothetical protein
MNEYRYEEEMVVNGHNVLVSATIIYGAEGSYQRATYNAPAEWPSVWIEEVRDVQVNGCYPSRKLERQIKIDLKKDEALLDTLMEHWVGQQDGSQAMGFAAECMGRVMQNHFGGK